MALVTSLAATACSGGDDATVLDLGPAAVGTCLDFENNPVAPDGTVQDLPEVPCTESHTHEIYSVYSVPEDDQAVYPGFDALESIAQVRCLEEFEAYVGISAFDSELFFSWMLPTLNTWERDDDREIICVLGEGNAAPMVGSLRDAGR